MTFRYVVELTHLSASIILLSLSAVMLFVGGVKYRWFIAVVIAVAIGAICFLMFTDGYANDRVQG